MLIDSLRMISWLASLPLQTVQDVVHLLYPQSRGWRFNLGNDCDGDEHIFRYFTWSTTGLDSAMNSAVIAFQPPWILSEQDIKEFSECRSVSTVACTPNGLIYQRSFPLFANQATPFRSLFRAKKDFGLR